MGETNPAFLNLSRKMLIEFLKPYYLSRVLYIRFFVKYDENYEETKPVALHWASIFFKNIGKNIFLI